MGTGAVVLRVLSVFGPPLAALVCWGRAFPFAYPGGLVLLAQEWG